MLTMILKKILYSIIIIHYLYKQPISNIRPGTPCFNKEKMTEDFRLQKFRESFASLNSLLDSFKNSDASELPKDLKFYRTVFGKVTIPSMNNIMVTLHNLQDQLNSSFLPKRYSSGNFKIFNNHQLEMIVIHSFNFLI